MTRKRIGKKLVRVAVDQVSHEIEVTPLTDVQLAFDRVRACADREMQKLSVAECHQLATKLLDMAAGMLPHQDCKE